MNPELHQSLVILSASTATYIVIAAIIGMLLSLYCGYRIGKLSKKPKPEANAKPKTYVKEHTFTQEQTLQLAGLWDAMEDGKRLPKVKFWQTLRAMVPEEDNHESMEIENTCHSRWKVKITKDVEEAPATPKAPLVEKTPMTPLPLRIIKACHEAGIPIFEVIAFHTGLVAPPGKVTLPPGTEASYQEGLDVRTGMLEEQARP